MRNKTDHRLSAVQHRFFVHAAPFLVFGMWLAACGSHSATDTKFQQYYVQGEQLYVRYCSNCHQKNGAGLGRVYPPLNTSDYMERNLNEVLCIMKYGKKGSITVNGVMYNLEMKGTTSLTELEIAEIATYIYNTWDHKRGIVDLTQVHGALAKCQPN